MVIGLSQGCFFGAAAFGEGGQLWDCFGGVGLCLGCVWEADKRILCLGGGGGRKRTQLGLGGWDTHLRGHVMEVSLL